MIRPRISAAASDLQSLFLIPAIQTSTVRFQWHRQHTTRIQVQRSRFQQPPQAELPPKTYFQPPSDPPKTYFQPPSDPPPPPPSPPPSYFQPDSRSPPPPIPPPPRRRSKLRTIAWVALFLSLGYYAGTATLNLLVPVPSPPLSHAEMTRRIRTLNAELNHLPIVKELRRDPELWQEWVAYSLFTPEERQERLTSGVLSSLEAVPVQRIFMNKRDGKVINVIWLGNSVSGWPRVVHGGLLATILDETMARVAVFHLPAKTGVTATLEVSYRRMALTNQFFIVRADLVHEGLSERKAVVHGTVETLGQEGPVTEAKGLFVVPKNMKLGQIREGF